MALNIHIDSTVLKDLLKEVKEAYGYDFTDYAEASFKRRILHFMMKRKIQTLEDLKLSLLGQEQLFEEFIRDISVTVTEMFRDPQFYIALREKVLPRLGTYPVIKIWIAGCATGEEVYSMAILMKEAGLLNRTIIYATDINQNSLQVAKNGIYHIEDMKRYTENYQKAGGRADFSSYYIAKYEHVIFDQSLCKNVIFSPHNLVTDKSFNEFQMIICRNVLIYFNQSLQNRVLNLFYSSLCPFGFLGLGNKESLLFTDKRSFFREIDMKEKIFMKNGE